MRYAVANDFAKRNPVAEIKPADVLKSHKRRNYARVGAKELPELLRAIDGYVGGEHTRRALQFMALTFVRPSELSGARWSEFDLKTSRWDIPAERNEECELRTWCREWQEVISGFGLAIIVSASCWYSRIRS